MVEYSRDSSFNMGIAHLTRIDALLYNVAETASQEDYKDWHKALTILSREVFFLFNDEEMKENNEKDNACVISINKYYLDKSIESKSLAYNSLIDYELFVKKQLVQRKMLMSFGRDVRSAISDIN